MIVLRILVGLILIGAAPAGALAQGCANSPAAILQFQRPTADEIVEHTVPPEKIAQLSSASGQPPPHPLMAMGYALDSQIRVIHNVLPGAGGYCDAPESIVVTFGIVRRDIYMVAQAATSPCVREALLGHEDAHHRTVNRATQEFLEQHRSQLAQMVDEAQHRMAPTEEAARAALEANLYGVLGRFTAEFGAELRGPLRRSVDNPGELSRLDAACDGASGAMGRTMHSPGVGL